jgi:protein TonB
MPQSGFLAQKPRSPGSLATVIALHAVVLGAVIMAKSEVVRTKHYTPIDIIPIKEPPVPPPEKKPVEQKPQSVSRLDTVPPVVPQPRFDNPVVIQPRLTEPVRFTPLPIGPIDVDPPADPSKPVHEPVRTEARMDSRSDLQPPYPAAEERAEVEGSVTVRLVIGADGRVKEVEKVRATNDAFFRSTQQQALRHWRFKPATVDGQPVESRTTMTVHFRLDA